MLCQCASAGPRGKKSMEVLPRLKTYYVVVLLSGGSGGGEGRGGEGRGEREGVGDKGLLHTTTRFIKLYPPPPLSYSYGSPTNPPR